MSTAGFRATIGDAVITPTFGWVPLLILVGALLLSGTLVVPGLWIAALFGVLLIAVIALLSRSPTRTLQAVVLASLFVKLSAHPGWSENEPYVHPGVPVTASACALAGLLISGSLRMSEILRKMTWPVALALGTICLLAISSMLWAPYRDPVIFSLMLLAEGIGSMAYWATVLRKMRDFRFVITAVFIGLLLTAAIGVVQYVTSSSLGLHALGAGQPWQESVGSTAIVKRVSGLSFTPNEFARTLVIWIPSAALFSVLPAASRRLRRIAGLSAGLGFIALLLTASRGGLVSLVATLFIGSGIYLTNQSLRHRLQLRIRPAFLILTVASVLAALAASGVVSRFTTPDDGQAESRVTMADIASAVIQDNIFLGVGLNSYRFVMERYDDSPDRITETFFYPVHNVYLLLTAELGVGAMVAFLILFLLLLIASISGIKSEQSELSAVALCACLALVAFGIDGLFEGDTIGSTMFLHFWTAAGLALAVNAERQLRA